MMDRRSFLKYIGAAGAAAALASPAWGAKKKKLGVPRSKFVPPPGVLPFPPGPYPSGPYPTTDPSAMMALQAAKYGDPLLAGVPVFTPTTVGPPDVYDIQMAQTTATVSSAFGNVTKVYAYGQTANAATLHYPGFSFDVAKGYPITVNYTNNLPNAPHILPTDPTIDGATAMAMTPLPYPAGFTLPAVGTPLPENRAVVHLHGGYVDAGLTDGWPDWWTIPAGTVGTIAPQVQTVGYSNNQPGCCLWYHDHGMATTRLNVHAGLAGFYFIRDPLESTTLSFLPGPGKANSAFEIPLVIQDRMFDVNGQFLFPHQGSGGMIVNPTVYQQTWPSGHPYWVPEYFGDVAVVNGTAWPNLNVERRKYRFRLLNGCNARFLNLTLRIMDPLGALVNTPFYVIGTEQGFLKNLLGLNSLFVPPAGRFDVLVDFSKYPIGTKIYLYSDAVGPFPGGGGNVLNELMSFTVTSALVGPADFALPTTVDPAYAGVTGTFGTRRYITLNEWMDPATASSMGMQLGEGQALPGRNGLAWGDPVTITPKVNTWEWWYFINRTGDAHPMHVHLSRFQVNQRFFIDAVQWDTNGALVQVGPSLAPQAFDQGWKDTVAVPPGDGVTTYQVTVIQIPFGLTGAYPYHCHIIDHEDNDMMRWFNVVP
jgi:spore coat protein A, manganese oxidase